MPEIGNPTTVQGQVWRSGDGRALLRRQDDGFVLYGEFGRSVVAVLSVPEAQALGEAARAAAAPRKPGPKETKEARRDRA